jgi:putative tricarboxylic transport membrane protein
VKINDAIWGGLFILGAVAVIVHVQSFPRIPGQNVGPGLFPGIVAAGIGICGLILVARGLRERAAAVEGARAWVAWPAWLRSPRHLGAVLVLVGVNVFYVLAVERLGFFITAFVYLAALMSVLRVRLLVALPTAIVCTFGIHYAFYKLLKVPLPWGVLTPFAW